MRRSTDRRRGVLGVLGLLALATWTMASDVSAQPEDLDAVRVHILIYSGRPDPVLVLDPADAALDRLRRMLATAPPAEGFEGETVTPAVLGYKGLLITNPRGLGELPERIALHDGVLEVRRREDAARFMVDEGRGMEAHLLRLALTAGVIEPDLLEAVGISPQEEAKGSEEEPPS